MSESVPLNPKTIFLKALEVLDDVGPERLTVQELATRMNVELDVLTENMRGRALGDGIFFALQAELGEHLRSMSMTCWETALREVAQALLETLVRHPFGIPILAKRAAAPIPTLALNTQLLRKAGLHQNDALMAVQALCTLVIGHAFVYYLPRQEDDPHFSRVGYQTEKGLVFVEPADEFQYSLECFLSGLRQRTKN